MLPGRTNNNVATVPLACHDYAFSRAVPPVISPSSIDASVPSAPAPKLLDRVRWHLRVKHYRHVKSFAHVPPQKTVS